MPCSFSVSSKPIQIPFPGFLIPPASTIASEGIGDTPAPFTLLGSETDRVIQATLARLGQRVLTNDPLALGMNAPNNAMVSSLIKREGHVLQQALTEALQSSRYQVWTERTFAVSSSADLIARTSSEETCRKSDLPYGLDACRTIEIDLVVYDTQTRSLSSYEVKRGGSRLDGGKTRSTLQDLRCARMQLRSYGHFHGLHVDHVESYIVSYYGQRSLPLSWSLSGAQLDQHFEQPVTRYVNAALDHYREQARSLFLSQTEAASRSLS